MSTTIARDEEARRRILEDLDTNFLVEAGAGSGKTTSLVGRMLSLIRRGVPVERIAAVTFTRKAAGELREKFQIELERSIHESTQAEERTRLAGALQDLDHAFLGTIHAFCGRLLRERALEAGVVPSFEELEEESFGLLQDDFWNRWMERCRLEDDPALARITELGISPARLIGGFGQLVQNPDVDFPTDAVPAPELDRCRRTLIALLDRADKLIPDEEPTGGWDPLQLLVRRFGYLRSEIGRAHV